MSLPSGQISPRDAGGSLLVLILLALLRLLLHLITNGEYGFHRDELVVLDDARFLAWGYVAYPPVTPFIARVALELFGPSLTGVRLFSALAQSVAMVLTGLMAHELGGGHLAQVLAALAAAVAPMSLIMGALFQYISFDYLWWVLTAYLMIRLLKSDDPRWWLAIGATIGVGLMTKYTIVFCAIGVAAGVVLTPARRYLRSGWLWGGVALSLLLFLPNLLWQMQREFVSLEFLKSVHERDMTIGRTDGFLVQQLFVSAALLTLPLWVAGLHFYFLAPAGRRFRAMGWMYVAPLVLFLAVRGRFYYLAPAYPMLLAAGSVAGERWLASLSDRAAHRARILTWMALTASALVGIAMMLPVAPVNSMLWKVTNRAHDNFAEQIGWLRR